MKRTILIIYTLFVSWAVADAQKTVTLGECYKMADEASAISKEADIYSEILEINDDNLRKNWLPTLDANGSFLYNSSVVDLTEVLGSIPIPGISDLISPLPNEQYKVTLDINQMIYDGGTIKSSRILERTGAEIDQKQSEADLYQLRGEVNGYYFNILLLDRQKELLENYLERIDKRISSLNSALQNGMVLKTDIDVLLAERLKLSQQLTENGIRRRSLIKILSDITGYDLDDSTVLVVPDTKEELTGELTRLELEIFDIRKEQLNASQQLLRSNRMPKVFGFATLGYGNPPGNNFFADEFSPYYIVGASVKWNIFDWNGTKNEIRVVELQQEIINGRESDLTDNLKRILDTKHAEISSLESLIATDTELIDIRKRITAAAESQYWNGTITATEYLNELNSEKEAAINLEIHRINHALSVVEYMNISGKEIK